MTTSTSDANRGDLPFAQTLFTACDQLRGSVESAEYKHLVLGLIFLKYVSDSFERRRPQLGAETSNPGEREEILEDRDEYLAENVFWVPREGRWGGLLALAGQPDIGERIDAALRAIEAENSDQLRGVLPQIYARAQIAPETLGELLGTIGRIGFGDDERTARDLLGRVYEYFIKTFARAEGHRGGEFYTPSSVTRLLVEMLEPYEGRVYDPAFGSGGLFVQSAAFVDAHGGRPEALSVYGQENNQATWRIGRMNLAIHGLSGRLELGNTLLDDRLKDLRADFVMANPPFNQKQWGADRVAGDVRWRYGEPPAGNANYAWIQHFIHHLAPGGRAGFVLANGSLTAGGQEGRIREEIICADLVDCVVALPAQLFFTTGIPVCLWFLTRDKARAGERERTGETLFIDARQLGEKISRTQIELTDGEIARIAGTYRAWRGTEDDVFADEPGFAKSVTIGDIDAAGFTLSPGRFVGAQIPQASNDDSRAYIEALSLQLAEELATTGSLADDVQRELARIGFHTPWR